MQNSELIQAASKARAYAYAPYSKFPVGAALLTKSGKIFAACNMENVSFGLTICAERAAVLAAISAGERDFVAVAVVADSEEPAIPCAACRQVLAEFNPSLQIAAATVSGRTQGYSLSNLLPSPAQGILESRRNV